MIVAKNKINNIGNTTTIGFKMDALIMLLLLFQQKKTQRFVKNVDVMDEAQVDGKVANRRSLSTLFLYYIQRCI